VQVGWRCRLLLSAALSDTLSAALSAALDTTVVF
jgi:hypothetical protein